jgi:hypothetical protein
MIHRFKAVCSVCGVEQDGCATAGAGFKGIEAGAVACYLCFLKAELPTMSLAEVARRIAFHWERPYFGAVPYLKALSTLGSIDEAYGADTGVSVVLYFLSNATTWRGEVARAVKAELKKRAGSVGRK